MKRNPFYGMSAAAMLFGCYTAWRHGYRWLVALAAASGLAGALGPALSSIGETVSDLVRLADRLRPRGALGWGLSGVLGAFVFLAFGVRRSLHGNGPRRSPRSVARPRLRPSRHGEIALALFLVALAGGSMLSALGACDLESCVLLQ